MLDRRNLWSQFKAEKKAEKEAERFPKRKRESSPIDVLEAEEIRTHTIAEIWRAQDKANIKMFQTIVTEQAKESKKEREVFQQAVADTITLKAVENARAQAAPKRKESPGDRVPAHMQLLTKVMTAFSWMDKKDDIVERLPEPFKRFWKGKVTHLLMWFTSDEVIIKKLCSVSNYRLTYCLTNGTIQYLDFEGISCLMFTPCDGFLTALKSTKRVSMAEAAFKAGDLTPDQKKYFSTDSLFLPVLEEGYQTRLVVSDAMTMCEAMVIFLEVTLMEKCIATVIYVLAGKFLKDNKQKIIACLIDNKCFVMRFLILVDTIFHKWMK